MEDDRLIFLWGESPLRLTDQRRGPKTAAATATGNGSVTPQRRTPLDKWKNQDQWREIRSSDCRSQASREHRRARTEAKIGARWVAAPSSNRAASSGTTKKIRSELPSSAPGKTKYADEKGEHRSRKVDCAGTS
jgi:hypothetical protein